MSADDMTNDGAIDPERYRVDSRMEILRVLGDLARGLQLVTAYFNEGSDFILTTILRLDEEHNRLVLDYGPDDSLNQRLLAARRILFVTRHNQVRVQFTSESIQKATFQGAPAFVIPLPASIIRIQRREYYRLATPIGRHLNISLATPDGGTISAHIVDISVGGVGIIEPPEGRQCGWEPGSIVPGCRIELPEEGVIHADIEIRNRYQVDSRDGTPLYRIGCRLLGLDSRSNAAILRYIHRVELERRKVRKDQ
ncbi:flagellar brake protein [Sulfurivermis fontis]|uniref:flagellar brake protein n=1 Tax=Sulfurivermis fontis TaxID=1972068 RepID=UPI000FDC698B|nr:flagellar brake protein [Sulfurivermis fontis]